MKELQELSIQLGQMGILQASLEIDYQRLGSLLSNVNEYFDEGAIVYNSEVDAIDRKSYSPGFTLQLNGVKMYFNDPKTVIEQ